jgi:hypothetical protein
MKYGIEITDEDGNSCRIRLRLPSPIKLANPSNSKWRVLDEGFLKFRSGGCKIAGAEGSHFFPDLDLYLCRGDTWGLMLYEFTDWTTIVNESGTGTIVQPWCLTFVPYHITWTVT